MFKNYWQYINESQKVGGVVFIKGKILDDGTQRLYAMHIKGMGTYARFKAGNKPGKPANMVHLDTSVLYRIVIENGVFKAVKVEIGPKTLENLGLKSWNVVLNSNKTPFHRDTTDQLYVTAAIRKVENSLREEEGIRWQG
jgi:hypothetical protein